METREATYPDYASAVKAGEVARGWIPAYIPESATNISIKYDIENNNTWLFFHVSISDLPIMLASCNQVSKDEVHYPLKRPSSWWPGTLTDKKHDQNNILKYFHCKDEGTFAIDDKKREVYFWRFGWFVSFPPENSIQPGRMGEA